MFQSPLFFGLVGLFRFKYLIAVISTINKSSGEKIKVPRKKDGFQVLLQPELNPTLKKLF